MNSSFCWPKPPRTAVGSFGRKENHGIVSPVIPERLACLRIPARDGSFIELLHGHQFHSGHSQGFEIGDLFHKAPVGPRMVHARRGMNGKAANMRFVNDGLRPWMPGRLVSIPIEGLVYKYAFGHRSGIVQLRENHVPLRRRRVVSTRRCKIPRGQPRNRGSVGIEEKPVEIETMSLAGFVRAIHAVGIELTGADPLHPDVPYVAGAVARRIQIDYPGGRCVFGMVEQLQSNAAGVAAENGEINPSSPFAGPKRQRKARPNVSALGDLRDIIVQLAFGRFHHRCHRIRADSNGTATPER